MLRISFRHKYMTEYYMKEATSTQAAMSSANGQATLRGRSVQPLDIVELDYYVPGCVARCVVVEPRPRSRALSAMA